MSNRMMKLISTLLITSFFILPLMTSDSEAATTQDYELLRSKWKDTLTEDLLAAQH